MRLVAVKEHAPLPVDDGDTETLQRMLPHITQKLMSAGDAILAQHLHDVVVIHLQTRMQNVYLILLFTLILINAEANGEKQEYPTDAQQQVSPENATSRNSNHSPHVF